MARSTTDTLIYATILLAPLATAIGYIALTPAPEPVIVTVPTLAAPCPELAPVTPPKPATPEPATPEPTITPEPTPTPTPANEAGAGMLVHARQLVLATDADRAWAHGRLRGHPLEDGIAASKAVDPGRLPEQLRPLMDARVVVYGADGGTCTAQVGAMSIYGQQNGQMYYSDDYSEDHGEPNAAQLLALRKQVFDETTLMLGKIQGAPRCNGLWARRADLPAPAVFAPVPEEGDGPLAARVLDVLETEPAVIALRAEYDAFVAEHSAYEELDDLPPWSQFLRSTLRVTRWTEVGGARTLVNVEVGEGDQGCGDYFTTQVAVLFTLDGAALVAHEAAGFLSPLAVMDLERDGSFEAVTDGGYQLQTRTPGGVAQSFSFPYHGCPC